MMKAAILIVAMFAVAGTTMGASPPPAKAKAPAAAPKTIAEAAAAAPFLSTLLAAVSESALLPAATNASTAVTVFAPNNAAFNAALKALKLTPAQLLANKPLLNTVLSYHVVPAVVFSTQLKARQEAGTVLGSDAPLIVTVSNGTVTVRGARNSAKVVAADVRAGKSVVHVIDTVLLPPAAKIEAAVAAAASPRPPAKKAPKPADKY